MFPHEINAMSFAIRLLIYPLLAYLVLGALLYLQQDRILFPAPKTFDKTTPAAIGLRFEDLEIPVGRAGHVHAWWIPAGTPTEKVILAFHGNAEVLEDMVVEAIPVLREIDANLLLIDYRGYGSSTSLSPEERTLNEDADAAIDYLLRRRQIAPQNIFLLGRSIGSGPATYLASKNDALAGLILESPFSSVDEAASSSWQSHIYPVRLMLRTHFNNLARIGLVRAPVLIVSGEVDTLAPSWMAVKLFGQAHEPKRLYLVPHAGHNDLLTRGGTRLVQTLREFVDRAGAGE